MVFLLLKSATDRPSLVNTEDFISIDPFEENSKTLFLPSDSNVVLVCYGEPIIEKDLLVTLLGNSHTKTDRRNWSLISLYRNNIGTHDGPVYIFPDGTFKNALQISPQSDSQPLTGLDMMLPIEYNPDTDSNAIARGLNDLAKDSPETVILESLDEVVKSFDKQLSVFPQEKVYLHTDKPYYLSGEKIWFRAHIVDAASHIPALSINCVFVELFDMRDSVICRVKTGFENDMFSGYIPVPEGGYILRAYTNTMRNMDEDYFFMKNIRIANPVARAIHSEKYTGIPLSNDDFDVAFYPEGGNALYGCMGRIAFKSIQRDGREIDISGIVYDRQGGEITRFKTDVRGMGAFLLTPEQGKTYYAVCTNGKGQSKPV